jgi:hypothetical protein
MGQHRGEMEIYHHVIALVLGYVVRIHALMIDCVGTSLGSDSAASMTN